MEKLSKILIVAMCFIHHCRDILASQNNRMP